MKAQVLATIFTFALTYCLLRLRHFILASGKDKRKYYRAYIARFDETDLNSDPDDHSEGAPGAGATVVEWPTELKVTDESSTLVQEAMADAGKRRQI